jgi:hypothetical protein
MNAADQTYSGPDGETIPDKFQEELEKALVAATEKVVGRMASPTEITEKMSRTKYSNGWVVYRWLDKDLLYCEVCWRGQPGHRTVVWRFVHP